jgi:ribosomal-protein-alanine N-acetyltransferase
METERLLLRGAQPGDEDDLYEIRNSEYVLKYNCMKKITLEQLQEQVLKDMESMDTYCIVLKENGKVIGKVDIDPDTLRYGVNALCISYYLGEQYASKGYMTEALREMIRYVFEERLVEVLSVRAFKDNEASIRLIEKLGFIHEGCIRRCVKGYQDIVYDDMIFSILQEEYKNAELTNR